MKLTKKQFALAVAVMFFTGYGCARFTTTQTDTRENAKTGEKTTIVMKATSTTFFDSKSALTAFKASQTDKTQGASVGSLNQESSDTNAAT